MRNASLNNHLESLRKRIFKLPPPQASQWIVDNTRLKEAPFSFVDHEYQKIIADDTARIKYIRKCSQVGISELSVREILAFLLTHAGVNGIYVLPTALFAASFASTRLNPVIDSAPMLTNQLYPGTDSALVKRFQNNSFIFMRGASKGSQTISVPCDYLVIDEEDFADDPDLLTDFTSRLTHSSYKYERHFSTPTFSNHGISYGYTNSIRHVQLTRCPHCNHTFAPDYYKDIVLPGLPDNDLQSINFYSKALLAKYDLSKAYLRCANPKCHRPISTQAQDLSRNPKARFFVAENKADNFDAHGYQITPFCAPKQVPPAELIRLSTRYRSKRSFINNALGLPHEDSSSGITKEDVDRMFDTFPNANIYPHTLSTSSAPSSSSLYTISGTDMGGTCAHLVAYPAPDGHLRILSASLIPLHSFSRDFTASTTSSKTTAAVVDAFPYTDTITALQKHHHQMWAAAFASSPASASNPAQQNKNASKKAPTASDVAALHQPFRIREVQTDETKATYGMRVVEINRDAVLEVILARLRDQIAPSISIAPNASTLPLRDTIEAHLTDMKRLDAPDTAPVWKRSQIQNDHFMMALIYLVVADMLKSYSMSAYLADLSLTPLVTTLRTTSEL